MSRCGQLIAALPYLQLLHEPPPPEECDHRIVRSEFPGYRELLRESGIWYMVAFLIKGYPERSGFRIVFLFPQNAKKPPNGWLLHLIITWRFPTLTWGDPTLPSALRRFTSEFGMGSGGTTALRPPGKFISIQNKLSQRMTSVSSLC